MAFLTCRIFSNAIGRNVTFQAVIPEMAREIPTVYLLHGLSDDHSSWTRLTAAELYARDRGIALILPDGESSFYADTVGGEKYFTYLTEELLSVTRSMFPLSRDRNKTFIAGNSMGGYGAFKSALTHPEIYGAAVSLSGALDLSKLVRCDDWIQPCAHRNWGANPAEAVPGSDCDLFALAEKLARDSSRPRPKLLQLCGTEDFLYGENQTFRKKAEALGLDCRYEECPGAHNWYYWGEQLPRVFDFFCEVAGTKA